MNDDHWKVFIALGNDRPEILIRLEDQVLKAVIAVSEGKSREDVMRSLHSDIQSLEKELAEDDVALNWFNLRATASSVPSKTATREIPVSPLASLAHHRRNRFEGKQMISEIRGLVSIYSYISGGLASPPISNNNSPFMPIQSSSKLLRSQFVNPRDLNDELDMSAVKVQAREVVQPQEEVQQLGEDDLESVSSKSDGEDIPMASPEAKKPPSEVEVRVNKEDDNESDLSMSEGEDIPSTAPESKEPPSKVEVLQQEDDEDDDDSDLSMSEGEDIPPTVPESEKPSSEVEEVVESQKPSEDSRNNTVDVEPSEHDEDDRMVVVKDDLRGMLGVESLKPLSKSEKDQGMVGVELVKDDGGGHPITGFDSLKLTDLGDSLDDVGENAVADREANEMKMLEVEGEPVGNNEEAHTLLITREKEADTMKTSDSSEDEGEPSVNEDSDTLVDINVNKTSFNSTSYVDAFEPRRSSRNEAAKNKSYPNESSSLKYINGKRKRTFEKEPVVEDETPAKTFQNGWKKLGFEDVIRFQVIASNHSNHKKLTKYF